MELEHSRPARSSLPFHMWILRNPTGIPPRTALARATAGMVVGGVLSYLLGSVRGITPSEGTPLPFIASVVGGSIVSPFAVVFITYTLDRSSTRSDDLLGYSGVMRELFYAGELPFLGAVGAGLGASQRSIMGALVRGALGSSAIGGSFSTLRGFGPAVGATAGLISGAVAGTLGYALSQLLV